MCTTLRGNSAFDPCVSPHTSIEVGNYPFSATKETTPLHKSTNMTGSSESSRKRVQDVIGCEPALKSYAYTLRAVASPDLEKLIGIKRQLQFRTNCNDEISRDSGYDSNQSSRRDSSECLSLSSRRSSPCIESMCKWTLCAESIESENALYSHLLEKHLKPILEAHQVAEFERPVRARSSRVSVTRSCRPKLPSFACCWEGCKAFGIARSYGTIHKRYEYLQSHLLSMHCGSKPYACLLNHCNMRFASQQALKAHMNSHANRAPMLMSTTDSKCSAQEIHETSLTRDNNKRRKVVRTTTPPPVGNSLDRRTSEIMCDTLAAVGLYTPCVNRPNKVNAGLLKAVKDVVAHLKKEKKEANAIQMLKIGSS